MTIALVNTTTICALLFIVLVEIIKEISFRTLAFGFIFMVIQIPLVTHSNTIALSVFIVGYANYRVMSLAFQEAKTQMKEHPQHSAKIYMKITIMHNLYCASIGKVVLPVLKTAIEVMVPSFTYFTIRMYHRLFENPLIGFIPFTALACTGYQFGLLYILSDVNVKSMQFLKHFNPTFCVCRTQNEKQLLQLYGRSFKALKVRVGIFYFVDRFLILNALGIMFDTLLFLLVNF